jgi:hypothetical protein
MVSHYKEMKYNKSVVHEEKSERKDLPAMLTKAIVERGIAALLAPGFGQMPKPFGREAGNSDNKPKPKCWGCGMIGHKAGDPQCKADPGAVRSSTPVRAKRKGDGKFLGNEGGPKNKKPGNVCQIFQKVVPVGSGRTANIVMMVPALQSLCLKMQRRTRNST